MEDYRLNQSGQEVQNILNGAAMQTELAAETDRAIAAEQQLQGNIDAEELARQNADAALQEYADGKVSDEADARQQADELLQGNIDAEEYRAKAAELSNTTGIDAINEKIPAEASAENKLVDNSSLQVNYYTKAAVDNLIQGLWQNDVIVGALPASGVANTIYRVPGDGVYSDYMWYDGAWQLLATYSANIQGYQYIGIATPATNPGTPSNNVFYFAHEAGTYTNFGALVVTQGINILKFDGTDWAIEQLVGIDSVPTADSANLATSGGAFNSIMQSCVFDLSAYSGATYADLSAALTAMNSLPSAYKKGGMSIKFVLSSDNKYVQARCMAQNFTTDVTQWQGVDNEPVAGSDNMVKSGGVKLSVDGVQGQISGQVINLEMGKRFLANGYSASSTYACTNILTGDGGEYTFPRLSDIGVIASYYVYKYISDSEGEVILGNNSGKRTATITGKFVVTFASVDSDDFSALVSNFYVGGLERGSLNQRVTDIEGGSILTNDLVKTTSSQGLTETQKANALNNLGISTELNGDNHTVPIIPEKCVKEGNKTLSEKLEEIDDAIYISEGGWETLTITPVNESLIKLDGNILSSPLRAYYTGILEAGTYKITGRSENSNYPFLATSDTGTGSYTRELSGNGQLYTDEVVTFNSAKYVRINGNKEGDNRIIIKKNTLLKTPIKDVVEEVDNRVAALENEEILPIRVSVTQATDAQGRNCKTYHICRRLNNTVDFVTKFGNKYNTPNANFDFYGIKLKNRTDILGDGDDVSGGSYFGNQTDFVMPLVVAAVENNNGDFPDNTSYFTGGFHGYGNATTGTTAPTSRVVSQNVYADGKLVSVDDDIFCNKVRMEVVTNVQACNTEVEDGTGREVIQQKIVVEIDALRTDVKVEWTALEAVTIYQLDGFGAYAPNTNSIRFIGSNDRGSYPSGTLKRTYTQPNVCRVINPDGYKLDITLDKVYDAGDYRYNTNSETLKAQVTTANKVYYHLVDRETPITLSAGDMVSYKGSYDFGKV